MSKLKNEINYDPITGLFEWARLGKGRRKNKVGSLEPDGYVRLRINGVNYPAHRVAWYLTHGEWPDKEIDHIDGNRSNNAIINLRLATRSQNCQNRVANHNSTSKYKGVSWDSSRNKWIVSIYVDGHTKHLGRYTSEEKAREKFIEASKALHAEFFTGRYVEA